MSKAATPAKSATRRDNMRSAQKQGLYRASLQRETATMSLFAGLSLPLLENITVDPRLGFWFDGGLRSYRFTTANGTRCTLGHANPGSYRIETECFEEVWVLAGACRCKQLAPQESDWVHYQAGDRFSWPAHITVELAVDSGRMEYIAAFAENWPVQSETPNSK